MIAHCSKNHKNGCNCCSYCGVSLKDSEAYAKHLNKHRRSGLIYLPAKESKRTLTELLADLDFPLLECDEGGNNVL